MARGDNGEAGKRTEPHFCDRGYRSRRDLSGRATCEDLKSKRTKQKLSIRCGIPTCSPTRHIQRVTHGGRSNVTSIHLTKHGACMDSLGMETEDEMRWSGGDNHRVGLRSSAFHVETKIAYITISGAHWDTIARRYGSIAKDSRQRVP